MELTSSRSEVPGEPGVFWCPRHKKEKTRLRCGRCERPVCGQCTVYSPAGTRCRECSSSKNMHIYRVGPIHYLSTFMVALILGAIGTALIQVIGLLFILYGTVCGTAIGKVVHFATRGKRGTPLAIAAPAGVVVGALVPAAIRLCLWNSITAYSIHAGHSLSTLAFIVEILGNPIYLLLYLALVIPALWYWIR